MTVKIEIDVSDPLRALQRIDGGPGTATMLRLEAVLTRQFQETQAFVHVVTGSLKTSGKINGQVRDGVWTGVISYGGSAPGAEHDPVRYAQIEAARTGGREIEHGKYSGQVTSHNFLTPILEPEPGYPDAILAYLRGET